MKKHLKSNQPVHTPPEAKAPVTPDPLDDIARRIAVLIVKQHRYLLAQERKKQR